MNHEADWQSRHFRDASNWKLNPKVFHTLDQLWAPLTNDLFADRMNTQLPNYVSFVLIQPEVPLPLRLKPRASPARRFWLWLTGKKNPRLGGITFGRLLLKVQAPFKLLCSKKVSMDFEHTLLYLIEVCEVKLGISSVREAHALKL